MFPHGDRMYRIFKHRQVIHAVAENVDILPVCPEFLYHILAGCRLGKRFLRQFIGIPTAVDHCEVVFHQLKKTFFVTLFISVHKNLVIDKSALFDIFFLPEPQFSKIDPPLFQLFKPRNCLRKIKILGSLQYTVQITFPHLFNIFTTERFLDMPLQQYLVME